MNKFEQPSQDRITNALRKKLEDAGLEFATENKNRQLSPEEIAEGNLTADAPQAKNIDGTQLEIDFKEKE